MIVKGPIRESIQVGGAVFTDLYNLIHLHGWCAGNAAARYSSLAKDYAAVGHQVTAGKTLYILGGRLTLLTATADATIGLDVGYGDTDVGSTSAAAPTNWVGHIVGIVNLVQAPSNNQYEFSTFLKIPATKYVTFTYAKALDVRLTLFGYER